MASAGGDDDAREAALWGRLRETGDLVARAEIASLYLPFARMVAATCFARRIDDDIPFGDYHQWAIVGMMESIDRFDPAREARFKTFASPRMRGRILDGLDGASEKRRQVAVRRRLLAERVAAARTSAAPAEGKGEDGAGSSLFAYLAEVGIGLALGRMLEDTAMFDDGTQQASVPDRAYAQAELLQLRRQLHRLLERLSPQERVVVQSHYLNGELFEDVARRMGLTRGRISQLHRSALARLRAMLAESRFCDLAL